MRNIIAILIVVFLIVTTIMAFAQEPYPWGAAPELVTAKVPIDHID